MSRPSDWEARKALRGTYLSGLKGKPVNYVFVIGRSEDYNIEQRVIGESSYFGDILKVPITLVILPMTPLSCSI
jgi:hypothetical protein